MRTKNTGVSKLAVLLVTIGLAFAAVMVLSGAWPPGEGNMAGTIAPAERYQSDQISDADVVLGDESVAKIMQTDEFEQSVNSTEVASSGANAAADDGRARAAADDGRARAAADDGRARAAADDARSRAAEAASKAADAASKAADAAKAADNAQRN